MQRILFLDIETDGLDATKIFVCVCKDRDTGNVTCHTEPRTFNKLIEGYDILVGHNILSFDAPILNRLWDSNINLSKIDDKHIDALYKYINEKSYNILSPEFGSLDNFIPIALFSNSAHFVKVISVCLLVLNPFTFFLTSSTLCQYDASKIASLL